MPGPVVYSLTALTGERRNENRRTVIMTVEVKRRTFIVAAIAFSASLPVTGLLFLFIGMYALVTPVIIIGGALWLWDSRQRSGLKLLNYQAILDTRRAENGVLYAAGMRIPRPMLVMHQRQTIPTPEDRDSLPLAAGSSVTRRTASRSRKTTRQGTRYL